MVETSLRPRPEFSTFLQSDANWEGDGLSYYDYKRVLRYNKVAILQQKKANLNIPGYKRRLVTLPKPSTEFPQAAITCSYRNAVPHMAKSASGKIDPKIDTNTAESKPLDSEENQGMIPEEESVVNMISSASRSSLVSDSGQAAGAQNVPRIGSGVQQRIKSATTHSHQQKVEDSYTSIIERPRTVPGTIRDEKSVTGVVGKPKILSSKHSLANSERAVGKQKLEEISSTEKLCRAYQWSTTTQRAYDDAGWEERMQDRRPISKPFSGFRHLADPVTQRLNLKRYNSEPADWQSFGCEWDAIQIRRGSYPKGPQSVQYHSNNRNIQQIPGYMGFVETYDEAFMDMPPSLHVRSLQPRPTNISRKANIPGYSGQVYWSNSSPAHSNMLFPEPTSARTHRMIPLEDEFSPFRRSGVLSKMVTTVSPYNPYNNIEF